MTRKPNFEGGYNAVLVRYGEFLKDLAAKEGARRRRPEHARLVEATKKAVATDHETAEKLNPDRVHPGPAGQLLMAEALLKAWNAPAIVTEVEIDAEAGKVGDGQERDRHRARSADGTLSWTQEDAALPFPINLNDPVTALAVKSSDVVDALDRQPLKVTGAKASEYQLKIDGRTSARSPREQLGAGREPRHAATRRWPSRRARSTS